MNDKEPFFIIIYTTLCPLIFHPLNLYLHRIGKTYVPSVSTSANRNAFHYSERGWLKGLNQSHTDCGNGIDSRVP